MKNKKSSEFIKNYWDEKGKKFGTDPRATINDHQFRLLEIDTIKNLLREDDFILDIGCGNGFSTLEYATVSKSVIGVDYSEPLIVGARKMRETHISKEKIEFKVMSALELNFLDEYFDVIIMERLLINLQTYDEQKKATLEAKRVLKSGGRCIISTVTIQG
ncbi:hypothetical protein LCGC14_2123510, partial [marine sediment metagenome]